MINRNALIFMSCFLMLSLMISQTDALDCKKIDGKKFKELFKFKYSGGQRGLKLDFGFSPENSSKFKIENCNFELTKTEWKKSEAKTLKQQKNPKSLNGLESCNKYDVKTKILNVASKKSFDYENFVYTKYDGKVGKFILKKEKSDEKSVNFSWEIFNSSMTCIEKYKLEIIDEVDDIVFEKDDLSDRKLNVDSLAICKTYSAKVIAITASDETVVSNILTFSLLPEQKNNIEKLNLFIDEISSNYVKISWESDAQSCQKYQLNLRSSDNTKIVYEKSLLISSTVINNLTSCTNYSVELIALNAENVAVKAVIKSFLTRSMPISGVIVKKSKTPTEMIISWSSPPKTTCISNFTIKYVKEDCEDRLDLCETELTVEKTANSRVLKNLTSFERYSLKIYANEITYKSDGAANLAENISFSTIDYDKLKVKNVNELRLSPAELLLKWNSPSNHPFFMKMLSHYQIFFAGNSIIANNSSVVLPVAACKKNYSVSIQYVSKDGYTSGNFSHQTNLIDDEVPLSLVDNFTTDFRNKSVMILWTPKNEEIPCISHYEIAFNDQIFITEETSIEMVDFAPCITYEVEITPVSHKGNRGRNSMFEFVSQEFASETPTSFELFQASDTALFLSVDISDDDKHCNSTTVEFNCSNNLAYVKNDLDSQRFIGQIINLKSSTAYNCSAKILNKIGSSKSTETLVFKTNHAVPKAPFNLSTIESSDNSIDVYWETNDMDHIENFKVYVTLVSLNYDKTKDCTNREKQKLFLETKLPKIRLADLEPFAKYTIEVTSENYFGRSEKSDAFYFMTKPSESSAPRDINISFTNLEENSSNVIGILKWKAPCKMNGKFLYYEVHVSEKNNGTLGNQKTESTQFLYSKSMDLKRGYEYEAKIQAWSSELPGKIETLTFSVPSGIPLEDDLKDWALLHPSENDQRQISIREGIFFSNIGEITGIAFIIFLKDCLEHPKPTSDKLSSYQELPSAFENRDNLMCSQLYQQSKQLSNPLINKNLNDDEEKFAIKFTIGKEECNQTSSVRNYCNGPLPPNQYGLLVRVFTSSGFRDSEPVFVDIKPQLAPFFSPVKIAMGSIGIIILISFIILLCCFRSFRKKKQILKEKGTPEADENLLSFTSYCVFEKNSR